MRSNRRNYLRSSTDQNISNSPSHLFQDQSSPYSKSRSRINFPAQNSDPQFDDQQQQNRIKSPILKETLNRKQSRSAEKTHNNYNKSAQAPMPPKNNESSKNNEDIYAEHHNFLAQYKRQHCEEIERKRRELLSSSMALQKAQSQSRLQPSEDQRSIEMDLIDQKMEEIFNKVELDLIRDDEDQPRYKLFSRIVRSKQDIERREKERRFVFSQNSKANEYQEPAINRISAHKPHQRIKTESILNSTELAKNAKEFTERIQKQQQILLGTHLMRRKKQEEQRKRKEKEDRSKHLEIFEIKKEQRRIKAEESLLMMREREKIARMMRSRKGYLLANENLFDDTAVTVTPANDTENSHSRYQSNCDLELIREQGQQNKKYPKGINKKLKHKLLLKKKMQLPSAVNPQNLKELITSSQSNKTSGGIFISKSRGNSINFNSATSSNRNEFLNQQIESEYSQPRPLPHNNEFDTGSQISQYKKLMIDDRPKDNKAYTEYERRSREEDTEYLANTSANQQPYKDTLPLHNQTK